MSNVQPKVNRPAKSREGQKKRLTVFVSSSMGSDEDGHDWMAFRSQLARQLENSSILEPFAIEEHGSPIPSEQYYLTNIEQADIVAAVVYGELRPGTESEIRYAVDIKKPLLFIKVGDRADQSTSDIIAYLHNIDFCTTIEREDFDDLPSIIVRDIENTAVDLFRGRLFEMMHGRISGIGVSEAKDVAMPAEVIESFGSSQTKLLKYYDCYLDWLEPKIANPQLEQLGNVIIDWAISGDSLEISQYKECMLIAMKESGCSEQILEHRYSAMDLFLRNDYAAAYSEIESARVSVANKDTWIYGNILIDKRNVASVAMGSVRSIPLATQDEIANLKRPIMFPLALKYECSAIEELETSQDNKRVYRPGTTAVDNRIACALKDIASYMFVSVLYGSIASLLQARFLLARVLLGYADVFESSELAYEGLRIALLAGDCSFFEKELRARFNAVSNRISSGSDELWRLSERILAEDKPGARSVLVKECASYFSDDVFKDSVQYLTDDLSAFCWCQDRWVKAINAIKLRMHPDDVTQLVVAIINEQRFITAESVGSIIRGYPLGDAKREIWSKLVRTLRDKKEELIRGGMSLSTFAIVEDVTGEKILDLEENNYASIEVAAYKATLQEKDRKVFLKECLQELVTQVDQNNSESMFSHFGRNVVDPICDALREKGASAFDEEDINVLESLIKTAASYQGALSVVDGVLKVWFEFECASSACKLNRLEHHLQSIVLERFRNKAFSFDSFSFDALECRLLALEVVVGGVTATKYLSKGVRFSLLSYEAKRVYVSTFAQIIKAKCILDEQMEFANAVVLAMSEVDEDVIRKQSIACIAACIARWGAEFFRDACFRLARDSADNVRYALLKTCMNDELGDTKLANEMYSLLKNDANWFIRWHAIHDESKLNTSSEA